MKYTSVYLLAMSPGFEGINAETIKVFEDIEDAHKALDIKRKNDLKGALYNVHAVTFWQKSK